MEPIGIDTIRALAATLAGNLRPLLPAEAHDNLNELLTPGVAAFLGALLALTVDQDVLPHVTRFLAEPITAGGLGRYAAGDTSAGYELYERLLATGVRGSAALGSYFPHALELLIVATNAAAHRAARRLDAAGIERELPFATTLDIPDYGMTDFVAACFTLGLDRVELGRAVGGDGTTIYVWGAPPMAGGPPEQLFEAEPPDQLAEAEPAKYLDEAGEELESIAEHQASTEPPPPPPSPLPPEPPPSQPPSPGETVASLRLDAAAPERVTVGQPFDLAVAVRRPNSPPLAPGDLTRRESADFGAVWPAGAPFIRLRLQIGAPECDIEGGDSRDVRLFAGQDGPPVYFHLTPRRAGPLSLIITVYQELDWIGSTRLRTEVAAGEQPRGQLAMTVASAPLNNSEANQLTLRRALDDGYNADELRDLCFELSIDYEDLPGETQWAKARELVLYARRHNLTAQLVALVMAARPHLLAS